MSPPQRPPPCIPWGSVKFFAYGYDPSLAVGITFTILFGLIALTQLRHAIRYRAIWMTFFVVGSGLECLGWIGRTVAHKCAYSKEVSTMQTATLIMGKLGFSSTSLLRNFAQRSIWISLANFSNEPEELLTRKKDLLGHKQVFTSLFGY